MEIIDIHTLVGVLIVIDFFLFAFILLLLKRSRQVNRNATLDEELKTFEALVREADNTAEQFKKQLQEKHKAVNELNARLDKRIHSLNILINRADAAVSRYAAPPVEDNSASPGGGYRQAEILKLAENGYSIEDIASRLSIQRGEVTLVLNMA